MKYLVSIGLIAGLWACQGGGTSQESADVDQKDLLATGKTITQNVGKTLLKTVQQKMGEGGVEAAIDYCRVNALPITDSLAAAHGVRVKRTALKTRNPENNPTALEREVLGKMKLQNPPQAMVTETETGQTVYYAPIVLKGFCQTCHGTPGETMAIETDSLIKAHYPSDMATGFAEGDLRGMWAVYFDE